MSEETKERFVPFTPVEAEFMGASVVIGGKNYSRDELLALREKARLGDEDAMCVLTQSMDNGRIDLMNRKRQEATRRKTESVAAVFKPPASYQLFDHAYSVRVHLPPLDAKGHASPDIELSIVNRHRNRLKGPWKYLTLREEFDARLQVTEEGKARVIFNWLPNQT